MKRLLLLVLLALFACEPESQTPVGLEQEAPDGPLFGTTTVTERSEMLVWEASYAGQGRRTLAPSQTLRLGTNEPTIGDGVGEPGLLSFACTHSRCRNQQYLG